MSSPLKGSPFEKGLVYRRVYDKSDIIIKAMLGAGLEEYITNGFRMEAVPVKTQPDFAKDGLQNIMKHNSKYDNFAFKEDSIKYNEILDELYDMEREFRVKSEVTDEKK